MILMKLFRGKAEFFDHYIVAGFHEGIQWLEVITDRVGCLNEYYSSFYGLVFNGTCFRIPAGRTEGWETPEADHTKVCAGIERHSLFSISG